MSKELEALKEAKRHIHVLITTGDWDEIEKQLDIVEIAIKADKKKLDIIGEILVDISKGNYADLNVAINEIREVLA